MENQKPITLDKRINQDLTELYRILHTLAQLKDIKKIHGISAAVELSEKLYSGDKHKDDDAYELSTLGLPGYFTGNRDAKTVMVMLNPGISAMENDNPLKTMKSIKDLEIDFDNGERRFIDSYIEKYGKFGEHKSYEVDPFDLKQAVFLSQWENTGVDIPVSFIELLKENRRKQGDSKKQEKIKVVIQNVLTNKLQLELIPYASRQFPNIGAKKLRYLFPYLETVLYEIFHVKECEYVIFCSNFFERLFKAYAKDKNKDFNIELIKMDHASEVVDDVHCTPVKITYNNKDLPPAIIAHTFSDRSLTNAYDKMQEYGRKCYKVLNKYKQNSSFY